MWLRERTLLAYEFDGEYLEEDYGGPARGFCPNLWGYKSAKSIVKVESMDRYISGFWEQRGYPDNALTTAGKVRDMNQDGRLRSISNGEVIRFLDEQIFLVSEALWLLGLTIELRFLPACKDG
jgi:DMSO/TMAO reductase YedYZ molybdopterin-dependent catalytic subunit